MLEREAASLGKVESAPKLEEAILLFSTGSSALLAAAKTAFSTQVPTAEAALWPHTPWEKGSGAGGWARAGAGAWETLHKGLPNDFAPVMQGVLRGNRLDVCCWFVCLIHHRGGKGETFSRLQEEHENLTPASRSLSPLQKYIPMETDS